MNKYTINQLAKMAGVSVRTLQYYDEIGLLKPHRRSKKNYRVYSPFEALKLQQILLYRELDYSLEDIQAMMKNPRFDFIDSLKEHKKKLSQKLTQIKKMIHNVDHTIYKLTHKIMLNDDELYAGFDSVEEGKVLTEEAQKRWGDEVVKSEKRIREMGSEKWQQIKDEGHAITQKLADLMGQCEPGSPEVQEVIKLFHKHMEHFYPVSLERLQGLGQLYVTDDRFRATYDKYKVGLADFINAAIEIYCERKK